MDDIDATPYLVDLASSEHKVTVVAPPGQVDGRSLVWPGPPPTLGADPPQW
jgi:hypothetical protein